MSAAAARSGAHAASILDERQRAELAALVAAGGAAAFDEPMARHTTLRIGGPVDAWIEPATVEQAGAVRAWCAAAGIPNRAAGAGSNLLVLDGGVRGVLLSSERLRRLDFLAEDERTRVLVGAGVSTGKLLSEATRRALGGVEFLGGVPGSVGGGLVMNAGTYLGEFTRVTSAVRSIDEAGRPVERDHAACGFVYRGSALPPSEMVVEGKLRLWPRERAEIEAEVRALRERRKEREPHGAPNAGSFFKNPPGDFAGRLIEACGLKGRRIGGAEISPAHANWIVNAQGATAAEVLELIELARAAVQQKFGLRLELEVKVLGEA